MSSKTYEEFKEKWGNEDISTLKGLNKRQHFNTHQDWYEQLISELEQNDVLTQRTRENWKWLVGVLGLGLLGIGLTVYQTFW